MQVGDILCIYKKPARVATVRMKRDRRHCRPIDARQSYKRACGQRCRPNRRQYRGRYAYGRDVVRAIAEHGAAGLSLKVSQLISVPQLMSCGSTDTFEHVRHLMNKNHSRHLPVIDNHSLIGVIGIRDIDAAFKSEATVAARSAAA
jgi:hypothetical protein